MTRASGISRRRAGLGVLTPSELRTLMRQPDRRRTLGRRDAALLAVLAGGGLRVGEAVSLTVYDLEQDGTRLRLTFLTSKTRAQRLRTVSLPTWAASPLRRWLGRVSVNDWVFPGNKGQHLSVRAAEKIVSRYLRAIGRQDLHTHSLRHTFGSLVTRETRSLFVAQKLLGHADPRTTSHYYSAFEISDADRAADVLSRTLAPRRGRPETDPD